MADAHSVPGMARGNFLSIVLTTLRFTPAPGGTSQVGQLDSWTVTEMLRGTDKLGELKTGIITFRCW
jgi:hypothetical protein